MFLFEQSMIHFNFPKGYSPLTGIITFDCNLWTIMLMANDFVVGKQNYGRFFIDSDHNCKFIYGYLQFHRCREGIICSDFDASGIKGFSLRKRTINASYSHQILINGEPVKEIQSNETIVAVMPRVDSNWGKIICKIVGENPGIGFYKKDEEVKFINPDKSKKWFEACLSADSLTCLAVNATGACILDVPF